MKTLHDMMLEVDAFEKEKGWKPNDNRFGESLALLHSEVSEALEAYRSYGFADVTDEGTGKPEGVASELADVFIRLLSTWCQFLPAENLQAEYERKMAYNRTRSHRHGGKKL